MSNVPLPFKPQAVQNMAEQNRRFAQNMLPQSFEQALVYADYLANSGMVPAEFRGKKEACLVAMQAGASLGLNPLQALCNIAVINGRPCLWGDAMLALVKASGLYEWINETREGQLAVCTVKRKGEAEQARTYSWEQATRAGLTAKTGPWKQHPERMLQLRARSLALRDVFPDVLMGFGMAEEMRDITPQSEVITSPAQSIKTLADYTQEQLETHLDEWRGLIQTGTRTAAQIIAMVSSKYRLSEEQKAHIRALELPVQEEETENNHEAD